jgi:ABC-type transporter lipoprotein component MlaA
MELYDAATQDAVDPYISARSAFIQNRAEATRK